MSNGGVLLSGWLRKSPPEKKLKRAWKKRWFILKSGRLTGDPNVLEYFKHQASKKALRIISLDECTQIDCNVPIRQDKDFVFDIVTKSRTYYLIAESRLEMATWVRCLCDLCGFNHDGGEPEGISEEQQTFKAVNPIGGANGTSRTGFMSNGADAAPSPNPRPSNTLTAESKPLLHNGNTVHLSAPTTVQDSSRSDWDSTNGYTESEQSLLLRNPADNNMGDITMPNSTPNSACDTNGYLHLSDFQTADTPSGDVNPGLLSAEKTDERRSSTDSVFTHESTADPSSPDLDTLSTTEPMFPGTSRFKKNQTIHSSRLDSMPDIPPPAPPSNVAPHRIPGMTNGGDPEYLNDPEEDEVKDAPRRSVLNRRWIQKSSLSPINDTELRQVPPGLQHLNRVDENGIPLSIGSYSSAGSQSQFSPLSRNPEYINTSDSRSESASSSQSWLHPSSSSSSSHAFNVGQVQPMSPIFPIGAGGALPQHSHYQIPPVSKTPCNTGLIKQTQHYNAQNEHLYSSPNSLPAHSVMQNSLSMSMQEGIYNTPPRPPKPVENFGPMLDISAHEQSNTSEGYYNTPRNCSTGSSSSSSSSRATYDVVRGTPREHRNSSISPVHTSIVGDISDERGVWAKSSPMCTPPLKRTAISEANSPLATPELRRLNISNNSPTPNGPRSESPCVTITVPQNTYDVPKSLLNQNSESSRQNSSSAESTVSGTTTSSSDVYDIPRSNPTNVKISRLSNADIQDEEHPNYEKMMDGVKMNNNGVFHNVQEDIHSYTSMAGTLTTPHSFTTSSTSSWSGEQGAYSPQPFNQPPMPHMPPPIHRDLKPGRKSLGSDGGSSQGVPDGRNWNAVSRDSIGSEDSMTSPPHSIVKGTIPFSKDGGRLTERLSPNPVPGRPPKTTNLPSRNSPSATQLNHLPGGRSFGESSRTAPERPPKPYNHSHTDLSNAAVPPRPPKYSQDAHSLHPPLRPPKSSTPSSGESLLSGSASKSQKFFGGQTVVPPPVDTDKGIQYIELAESNETKKKTNERPTIVNNEPSVEYIKIDSDKTMALQKTTASRQKAN